MISQNFPHVELFHERICLDFQGIEVLGQTAASAAGCPRAAIISFMIRYGNANRGGPFLGCLFRSTRETVGMQGTRNKGN